MEEKTIQNREYHEEVRYEEELHDIEEDERPETDSRHLALWVSVVIAVALILIGWLYFTKQTFSRIDSELQVGSSTTSEQATQQFQQSLKNFGSLIEEADSQINQIKEDDQRRQQEAQELDKVSEQLSKDLEQSKQAQKEPLSPEPETTEGDTEENVENNQE